MRCDLIAILIPRETTSWRWTLEMILEQFQLAEGAGFTTYIFVLRTRSMRQARMRLESLNYITKQGNAPDKAPIFSDAGCGTCA